MTIGCKKQEKQHLRIFKHGKIRNSTNTVLKKHTSPRSSKGGRSKGVSKIYVASHFIFFVYAHNSCIVPGADN